MTRQEERLGELIAREAAKFIAGEAVPPPAGGSLITVMRAEAEAHGERVQVFVSVFPVEKARGALDFLARRREAFSDHLKQHTAHVRLPRIDFLLDNRSKEV